MSVMSRLYTASNIFFVSVGVEGSRACAELGAADVRVPRHTKGARVHPGGAATRSSARARRTCPQVREGPKRKPRGESYKQLAPLGTSGTAGADPGRIATTR